MKELNEMLEKVKLKYKDVLLQLDENSKLLAETRTELIEERRKVTKLQNELIEHDKKWKGLDKLFEKHKR